MEIKRRNIKMDLQESIDKIEEEYSLYQQKKNYYKMYEALCTMFSSNDIDTLIESAKLFPLIYEGLSSKEEAVKLSNEMLECLYLVKKVNEKDYQEYYDTKRAVAKFNKIILKFEQEKKRFLDEVLSQRRRINVQKSLQRKYCFLKSKLDHQGVLSSDDISFLAEYMIRRGFEREQQILALEYIRIHNIKIKHPEYKISNQVIEMLHQKYLEMPINNLQSLQLTKYQSDIFAYQKALENSASVSEVIEMIEMAKNSYENESDYLFILKSLINIYVKKLNDDIEDLKENYEVADLRNVVLATYNEHRKKYYSLRKLYFKVIENSKKEETKVENVNELYYPGNGNSYLERDLKDIPQEKLLELKELLEKKKSGSLSQDEDSPLKHNEKLVGLRELRGDQVRICYRHLGGNKFAIVGAFIKKSDNLIHAYELMANRRVNINLENEESTLQEVLKSQAREKIIYDYILENYRIGSR